jgi:hypothetical protein
MRLNEFASAADTLALWKQVSDSVWSAVSQQAETEKRQRAAVASKPKKHKSSAARVPTPMHISTPVPQQTKKPQQKVKPQAATPKLPPSTKPIAPMQKEPAPVSTQATPKQLTFNPSQNNAEPQAVIANPAAVKAPSSANPAAMQQPLTPQQMRLQRQNHGYLARNSAAAKRM